MGDLFRGDVRQGVPAAYGIIVVKKHILESPNEGHQDLNPEIQNPIILLL
jgi:hypothetical protein